MEEATELAVTDEQLRKLLGIRENGWRYLSRDIPLAYRAVLGVEGFSLMRDALQAGRIVRFKAATMTLDHKPNQRLYSEAEP